MADGSWFQNEIEPYYKQEKAHLNSIETCCFNPTDSSQFITGSHDKLIKIWDLNKFKLAGTMEGHTEGVWCVTFSHDAKYFMSASPDKMVLLWDLKSKKPIKKMKEHTEKVFWASFNEDSKIIASVSEDQRLILWDLRKGAYQKIIKSENKIIYCVRWSQDGNFLFTSEYGGIIKAYDTKNFDLLDTYGTYHEKDRAWSLDMDFSKNSKSENKILVGYERKVLGVLDFHPQTKKFSLEYEYVAHMNPIKCITLNGPRGVFLTGCRDGSSRLWEVEKSKDTKGRIIHKTLANLVGHSDNVASAQFAPSKDGKLILGTVSWDQTFHLYKV